MKQIFENKIINIDDNVFDNRLLFKIADSITSSFEVDMSELLLTYKNANLDYRKDYKLWNEVYSPKSELALFQDIYEENLRNNKKIHISNISLLEEIQIIKDLYHDLGYFNIELNRFEVDMPNAPITIGVNINNLLYSFKDYNSQKENIFFIPPPREPRHQKSLKGGINSGIVSTLKLNGGTYEIEFLKQIIEEEKISQLKLARSLYFNYLNIGFDVTSRDVVINLS